MRRKRFAAILFEPRWRPLGSRGYPLRIKTGLNRSRCQKQRFKPWRVGEFSNFLNRCSYLSWSAPMLLPLDSNAFWVTKSTKDTRSARRKIIVRDLVWARFSGAFSSSCSTNTFQVRKPTKVLLQIGFLCAPSVFLRVLRDSGGPS
jgi:hypothetical protein